MLFRQKIRYFCLSFFWFIVIVLVFYRLSLLAYFDRSFYLKKSRARVERKVEIPFKRGVIYDRNSNVLAMSQSKLSLWTRPKSLLMDKKTIKMLAKIINESEDGLYKRISRAKNHGFMYIKRHLTDEQSRDIESLGSPLLFFLKDYSRFYPNGESISQLVGFTDLDGRGKEGIEYKFDYLLRGVSGYKEVIVNRFGETVELVDKKSPEEGADVFLTVDKDLQYSAYNILKNGVIDAKAKSGSAVVLDVDSADILAVVNYPSFDPNIRSSRTSKNIKNRAFTDLFEPGSTFKPISMSYILDNNNWRNFKGVDTSPGVWHYNGIDIKDVRNYGFLTVDDIMSKSSNIGMAKLVLNSQGNFFKWLSERGFQGVATGAGFPGEPNSMFATTDFENKVDTAVLSYGYGISLTAMQLAKLYLTIANGGNDVSLNILKDNKSKIVSKKVISSKAINRIKLMLKDVVSLKGTGRLGATEGIKVAGKTGTAHVYYPGKGYSSDSRIASFAGFAPLDNPKYVVVVIVNNPDKKRYFGGQVAAPIFSKILYNAVYLSKNSLV